MADGIFTTDIGSQPRKANEYLASLKHLKEPEDLFDEYWLEGELALLFGAAGTGKSILAMQLAEAIARGRGIDGFKMSTKRHKVLHVDLRSSKRQFSMRYSNGAKKYKFSENLYHDRPASNDKLCEWLRKAIGEKGFRVIVIDDLSAIRTTYDGTRETLKLMRDLRKIKDELDVSILALAGSREPRPGAFVSEADMMRSRVLCDEADRVLAIGLHPQNPHWRCIIQTRSQSTAIKWHPDNAPVCSIQKSDDGFLSFSFDERFAADVDEETRQLICNVKWRRDARASYRAIADELGISKSRAVRLRKKWTPALEKGIVVEPEVSDEETEKNDAETQRHGDAEIKREKEEWEICGFEKPVWIDAENSNLGGGVAAGTSFGPDGKPEAFRTSSGPAANAGGIDWSAKPFLASLRRIPITDLKRGFDGYGREQFILKEQNDGKPILWYQRDSKGKWIRKERGSWGVTITHIDKPWIPSADLGGS